uniref:UBX domain-containing protein n=1 Tax=Tetradesmus obliquus TaxID=3088 RepID=A0A383VHQ7_TETOB
MDDAQASVLQEFMAITGVEDATAAMSVLEATNWQLEEAVNLQFATGGDLGGGAAGGGSNHAGGAPDIPPELLQEEEEVRAPMPVMRDRLYGDAPGPHGIPARVARYGAAPERGPTHVDVFKDFNPAAAAAAAAAGGSGAAGAGGSSAAAAAAAAGGAGGAPKLSDLFKPPPGLAFTGDWGAAVAQAAQQGRWLLVNVQDAEEFATHRLNRDTWGDSLVQDMLRGTFVFWQCYSSSDQGKALGGQYHLDQMPACIIVDPITRAKLWERYGFVGPEALVEELVPYLDCGPNDPGASDLAHRAFQQSTKRRHKAAAAAAGPAAAAADMAGMTEDEQLAMALAMSVEQPTAAAGGPGPAAGDESDDDMDDIDEEAIWAEVQRRQRDSDSAAAAAAASSGGGAGTTPAAAQQQHSAAAATAAPEPPAAAAAVDVVAVQAAAAAARLPPEPAEGAAGSCRVAFRLPDGTRVQRRFNTTDTVAALQDYVISVSADAAGMAAFQLSEARPGAQPLADPAATLAAAGVANAMLVLKSS